MKVLLDTNIAIPVLTPAGLIALLTPGLPSGS